MHWRIGPLDLWVRQVEAEWRVAAARAEEERLAQVDDAEPQSAVEWRRWASAQEGSTLRAVPRLPDRSVVVRPGAPLQILPGCEARFFVGIPVWVGVFAPHGGNGDVLICEEHTLQLSKSWFGTPVEGELCYALKTRAKRLLDELDPSSHRVVCPLLLRNEARDTLDFQRLCLRARHLNVYQGSRHLWTNEGMVTFRGDAALAHVTYGEGPPPFDGAGALLSEARDRPERGFVSRTFDNLKAFAHG